MPKKILAGILCICCLLTLFACTDSGVYDTDPDTEKLENTNTDTETETDMETNIETNLETDKETDAETDTDVSDLKSIKILAIGNSFSVDAMQYLCQMLKAGGYEDVILGNLYIGGCSLNTHWKNISSDKAAYTYYKTTTGNWNTIESVKVLTALADEKWDIITVQQASGSSGIASSYSNLNAILNYVHQNKRNSEAQVLWHMTWAYEGDSTHSDFPKYNNDQLTMYNAIQSAIDSEVKTKSAISGIIPVGTAVQNLRTSYLGDNLTRDGYHMSYDVGRYTAALTWYAYLTGNDVKEMNWVPASYSGIAGDFAVIREAVENAIAKPYEITKSKYMVYGDSERFASAGLNIDDYELVELDMSVGTFYDSTRSHVQYDVTTNSSLAPKYTSTQKFTKEDLPVGTVIIVDTGYYYRPDAWKNSSTLTTSRPGTVSSAFTVVSDSWWGDFTLRGFNLSRSDGAKMTESDSTHIRIYVPKS